MIGLRSDLRATSTNPASLKADAMPVKLETGATLFLF